MRRIGFWVDDGRGADWIVLVLGSSKRRFEDEDDEDEHD